ncbi:hypothetical protein [Rubrolithibacter danxiaensis]|uniref:hypothetical protein n=1 Tax=Rubrolithibacter danxiaensis TaxID=3390805 RepID=UPI003BF7CB78
MKTKFYLLLLFGIFLSTAISAQTVAINNFIVKENLLKNEKLAIIAADENEKPVENVNGTFLFSINGFRQELNFHDGVAVAPQQIDKSAFIYIKHTNDSGTHGKLYYVLKKNEDLNPIKINWVLLVAIPVILILLASMFRKFLLFAAIILIVLFFFNHSKGLDISTFFETVFDGLKSAF